MKVSLQASRASLRRIVAEHIWQPLRRGWQLAGLAVGPIESVRLGVFAALATAPAGRRRSLRARRFRVLIAQRTFTLWIGDPSEYFILEEILLDDTYAFASTPPPALIVDLGANAGISVLYFRAMWPEAEIYAVEPDPATFARLQNNVAALEGVHLRCCALGAVDGRGVLVRDGESWTSRLAAYVDYEPADKDRIPVTTMRLETFLDTNGIGRVGLLKIDIEGAEVELLKQSGAFDRVDAAVGELHRAQWGPEPVAELRAALPGFEVRVRSAGPEVVMWEATRPTPVTPE